MGVYRWVVASIVLLCLAAIPASAAEIVKDLYQTIEVVSVDSTDIEINNAMSDGLASVVVRISGSTSSVSHPVINSALKNPKQYLSRFRYEPSTEIRTNLLGEVVHTKKLVLDFDVYRVKTLLASGLVPVWDEMRPTMLAWIAIERTNRREILSALGTDELLSQMDKVAQRRGLSYRLPDMDLIDQLSINESEVWGLFPDVILDASQRYNPEYILGGRIYPDVNNSWKADYLIISQMTTRRFQTSAATLDALLNQMAEPVAEMMSQRYAVVLGGSSLSSSAIGVSGVTSLKDYAALLAMFKSMGQVSDVQVAYMAGEDIILNVDSYGTDTKLLDNLHLYRDRLVPTTPESRPIDRPENEQWFVWQPQSNSK